MAENQNATSAQPAAPPKKSISWLVLLILVAGLAGGTAGAWWFFSAHSNASADKASETESRVASFLHLENFVVNLADSGGQSYLRVGIDLGLTRELASGGHGSAPVLPEAIVRDTILSVLTTWESDPLLTPTGKVKLKEQLTASLQERVPQLGVKEVYFNEFLVQR